MIEVNDLDSVLEIQMAHVFQPLAPDIIADCTNCTMFLAGMGHKGSPQEQNPTGPSEDKIRRATIGEPTVLNGQITLVEYNPEWPGQFARAGSVFAPVLGDRALRIEHVGSTSVPGLVAKPIIDILLVVANSADEQSYVPALVGAGYVLRIREPDWHEHRMFKGPAINLHVFTAGSVEIERLLLLRDRLRNHPEERRNFNATLAPSSNWPAEPGSTCRTTLMPSPR